MSRVVVIFTGGTISMRRDAAAGGNVPGLDGAALLALAPDLAAVAEVTTVDRAMAPGMARTFGDLLADAHVARDALADPAVDGAVVVQGTDTIEETSFLFDLLLEGEKPLVVTGAMRAASDPGFDGPANLADAVRVAASPALRGAGCVVVMAGEIHAADDVAKTHATALATFRSPNHGPLGHVVGGEVLLGRRRLARRHVAAAAAVTPIALVTAALDDDGWLLRAALGAGARGIVVAAAGTGNTSEGMLEAARDAIRLGIPVVLATRTGAGRVTPAYAFPGGGATWARASALLAGPLSPLKARVALALGLGAGLDRDGLAALLAEPSAATSRGGP